MPGDDLIRGSGIEQGTRAIDIAAPTNVVFDFLAQMGFRKAGWYSYDLLDNLGRKSATSINTGWLVTEDGDAVPGGPISFTAAIVDRPTAFVLQVPAMKLGLHRIDFTLSYRLDPNGDGTRLVSRARLRIAGPLGAIASRALLLGDGVMVRKQLLGLALRCEAVARGTANVDVSAATAKTNAAPETATAQTTATARTAAAVDAAATAQTATASQTTATAPPGATAQATAAAEPTTRESSTSG